MKLIPVLIAGLMLGAALSSNAETATNRISASKREHRFLLIVENSKAMGKRSEGIAHTVLDALCTGLKGQVKRGDTLGVWLFNEELLTGKFPLQSWGADNQAKVATSVVEFLQKQKFEKQGLPEKVLPTLGRVITNSPLITVLLISSGNAEVHGTGHDEQINAIYSQWREQQQQKKMPFVTVFRGQNGVLTHCAVSPAPWPLDVPPLPPPPIAQNKPQEQAVAAKKPAMLPPLIISGKKTEAATPKSADPALTNTSSIKVAGLPLSTDTVPVPVASTPSPAGTPALTNTPTAMADLPSPQTGPAPLSPNPAALAEEGSATPAPSSGTVAPLPLDSPSSHPTQAELPQGISISPSTAAPGPALAKELAPSGNRVSTAPLVSPRGKTSALTAVLLTGAGVCIGALLALWWSRALYHRSRPSHVSLITRSLDHTAP